MTWHAQLRQEMTEHFNEGDIETLCFDLGVDFDELSGDTKSELVISLVEHFEQLDDLPTLFAYCRQQRPNVSWDNIEQAAIAEAAQPKPQPAEFEPAPAPGGPPRSWTVIAAGGFIGLVLIVLLATWLYYMVIREPGRSDPVTKTPTVAVTSTSEPEPEEPTITDTTPAGASEQLTAAEVRETVAVAASEETAVSMDTSQAPDFGPERSWIGATAGGEPIEVVRFGAGPNKIVLVGGLHAGAAPATVDIAQRLVAYFNANPGEIPDAVTLYVIPSVNKDSLYAPGQWEGRINANDVDLNRNWDCNWVRDAAWRGTTIEGSGGAAPFSEPETRALRDFFLETKPVVVLFWEGRIQNGLISPGQCTSATNTTRASYAVADVYGGASGYRVSDFEALAEQTINGDVNNWLDSVGIPSFAVILEQYEDPNWTDNLNGVQALLASYEN